VLHSTDEPRFITVGRSSMGRLLVVVTSDGGPGPRIISARRATKRERDAYARLLMLGWHWADGTRGRVSSGRLLAFLARSGIGTLDVEEPVGAVS
jgi:hypothetical protein